MNMRERTEVLESQDSFDKWVAEHGGDKLKVAMDILQSAVNCNVQDDETKISETSKVVGFYWGMV
jgi:hypothetical protein